MSKTEQVDIAFDGNQIIVRGNTYPLKDTIKSAGFNWDKANKQWHLVTDKPEEPIARLKKDLESGYNIQINVHDLS